jgi:TolA-binding protein
MNKILSLVIIGLLLSNLSIAQSYKKAFKALNNKEYTSARVQFTQAQKNINTKAIGDYGMAVIQRSTALRTDDLYSAYQNAVSAKNNWPKCSDDVKKKNKDFISEGIINGELTKIDNLLFAKVKSDGSSAAWAKFIKQCPQSIHYKEAVGLLNTAAYNKAKTFNTIPVWEEFIKKYPNTKEAAMAQENIYTLAWEKASLNPTIEKLETFISKYPQSAKVDEAKKTLIALEYKKALSINTESAFTSFIAKYPDSEQAHKLQSLGIENDYKNAVTFKKMELCNSFIAKYPNSNHIAEIKEIRDSLAFINALKLNTPEAYEDFIMNYPNSKQAAIAMSKMGNLMYSKEELKRISEKNSIKAHSLKSITAYQMNLADTSQKVLSENKKYDVFGNCTYSYSRTTPELIEVYKYSFDDAGDKLLKTQYFVNNKIKTITYYTYNVKGLPVNAQIVCNFDCLDSTADYSDTMIYNNNRSLIEMTRRNSYGKIVEQHKNSYDSRENRVLENYSVLSNDSLHSFTIKYDYDGKGLLIQKTQKDEMGNTVNVGSYSYDGLSRMISSSFYDKIGTIYYTYFYGKDGALESETISNEDNSGKKYIKVYYYEQSKPK